MLYIIENNGVYGLTKGQFSASADPGSRLKKGEENSMAAIDPATTALAMGGSFVARSFSGDKDQLVPLIKAGIKHEGCAVLDVISPCVTFNDHEGSTKSYAYTRAHYHPIIHADYVEPSEEIRASYEAGEAMPVALHDGSSIVLKKLDQAYDPGNRAAALGYLEEHRAKQQILTGLLYVNEDLPDMHDVAHTHATPLADQEWEHLNPGADALSRLTRELR